MVVKVYGGGRSRRPREGSGGPFRTAVLDQLNRGFYQIRIVEVDGVCRPLGDDVHGVAGEGPLPSRFLAGAGYESRDLKESAARLGPSFIEAGKMFLNLLWLSRKLRSGTRSSAAVFSMSLGLTTRLIMWVWRAFVCVALLTSGLAFPAAAGV